MSAKKTRLDQLNVVSPCTADWAQMSGDDRKRHCAECNKFVYDFSRMSRRQVTAIVAAHRGSLCARITRRADSSLLTYEPLPDLPLAHRRTPPVAAAVVSAILGLSSPGVAQIAAPVPATHLDQDAKRSHAKQQPGDLPASISGTVTDPSDAVIPNAAITLINTQTGEERKTSSSEEGGYLFHPVLPGSYTLRFESPGFRKYELVEVSLTGAQELRLNAQMQVGAVVTMGVVMIAPPQPLRTLYQRSELIAIAEVGPSVIAEKENETQLLKTRLNVSVLLKGEVPRQGLHLYHWEVDEKYLEFASGDRLLVFLNRRRDEHDKVQDGYEAGDWSYGIKKLDDAALSAYRERIEELAALTRHGQPTPAEVVEWLVRCAEDPDTRWEGAQELARSVARLRECSAQAECPPPQDAAAKADEAQAVRPVHPLARPDEGESDDNIQLALALTPAQKQRLADALFTTEALSEQDLPLVRLVQSWNDARLIPFLVTQLRRMAAEAPPLAETLVAIIAAAMNDEELKKLADDYLENAIYSDDALESGESDEEDAEAEEPTSEEEAEESTTSDEPIDVEAKAQRAVSLLSFLALIERKLAQR